MAKSLTPDRERAAIALVAVAIVVFAAGSIGQIAAIGAGALLGLRLCGGEFARMLFSALFVIPLLLAGATGHHAIALFDTFYRSGALVFGGGHVVLPLLQAEVVAPGWVSNEAFLAAGVIGLLGYGVSLALFILALRHLGTARTGAYFSLAPFVGAALAVLILGEPLSMTLLIAGGLMGLGLWLHLSERHDHEHAHEAMEHEHRHSHDEHHQHEHEPDVPPGKPHTHRHRHAPLAHRHPHYPDLHHRHGH